MKHRVCRNCHSQRRAVYRNGYCGKCYTPARKLAHIESWDLDRAETLVDYPSGRAWRTPEYFSIFKTQFESQVRGRLGLLRSREEMYVAGASGILIERQLRSLSLRVGCRREVHYGSASRIDSSFDDAGKNELFRLLYEIEEQLPWSGLSVGAALDQHERTRELLNVNKTVPVEATPLPGE
jgi:hypothetical protein